MSRELPLFYGRPEEWPLFISSFENTTQTCGFSNAENLARLQRALKGKALEAVNYRLLLPDSVPGVIETLRLLFGRPEQIIHSLLTKVRAEAPPKAEKLETVIAFALAVQNLVGVMEASGLRAHLSNPLLLQELVDKLPSNLKLQWAMHQQTLAVADLVSLSSWLTPVAQAAISVTISSSLAAPPETRSERRPAKAKGQINVHESGKREEASVTRPQNREFWEKELEPLSRDERWELLKKNRLCANCFGQHRRSHCRRSRACGKAGCLLKHHPLLHRDQTPPVQIVPTPENICHAHQRPNSGATLFRIVPVTLSSKGKSIDTYAFLDEGSSLTMVDECVANELDIPGTPESLCLRWTSNQVREEHDSRIISLQISSRAIGSRKYTLRDVRTVQSLSLPNQTVSATELQHKYSHLRGTLLDGYQAAVPRILIGVDNWKLGLPLEIREGKWTEPVATRTRLGWTVHGNNKSYSDTTSSATVLHNSFHACRCNPDKDLHLMVKDFFSMENYGVRKVETLPESAEERRARNILQRSTVRINERFRTGLLWKEDKVELPNSFMMAKRRLIFLERKMLKDPELALNLNSQMAAYVAKGYARKLTTQELQTVYPRTWYLPVFVVTNQNKPGKVRMVWDAAAEVNGVSLNSKLLKGPDQLTSLQQILYGFRQRAVAIGGDIEEMFHQIQIDPEDQHSQRFLWRGGDAKKEPETFIMQVMTFGATCSPSSAHFVKNINAAEFAKQFPRAAKAITDHHYVDDLLDSVDTVTEAIKLAKEVRHIHQKGGFRIRNWTSNSEAVLVALGESKEAKQINFNISPESTTEKVLGMWWCTQLDVFTYSTKIGKLNAAILLNERRPTKREVLRTLMSVFDPLGFLAAFLINIKILLQEIWRSPISWDEAITDEQNERWQQWLIVLPNVNCVKIPRCYTSELNPKDIKTTQLHIFVDASENAFATVAYFRFTTDTRIHCALIGAKTKVAPQLPISIPRLELQAATLGARFASTIAQRHDHHIDKRVFWSDSQTVLSWLRSDPRKYRQYVAFRLGEILDSTDVDEWRWIPTKNNVADDATKWQRAPDLSTTSRWFTGPEFLHQDEKLWPTITVDSPNLELDEIRPILAHVKLDVPCTVNIRYFSNWKRLYNAQACLLRCARNISAKAKRVPVNLEPRLTEELLEAKASLYRRTQYDTYPSEIIILSDKKQLGVNSPIYRLSPYLDQRNVLRMHGRTDAMAHVDDETKRPVILPKDHYITKLIVASYHERYHHLNHETALNELRQKFIIPQARRLMKAIRGHCQKCKNAHSTPQTPMMAALPAARLAAFARPFSYVGVDCFGPMTIAIGRRTEKRWGMLFTCLTIRAIHVEVAHSMSKDSCIICLRNFIARRGSPNTIISDNGTNFHGADNELKSALLEVQDEFKPIEIKWQYIPPAAPHMGGSWERLVASVKKTIAQIMPTRNPSEELLQAVLIEAESIVNSRPLTFVSLESEDDEALTPNHFLLGSSSGSKPPGVFNQRDLVSRSNWRRSQYLANEFWRRWITEYLPTITRRTKWFKPVKNISVGDIVLIVDEKLPRNTWPMGRVLSVIAGRDHIVRRATVKTQHGTLQRPVVKLAVLDVYKETSVPHSTSG